MRIGITGGKGGTGKSTVATALAIELAKKQKILLVDADVDCPNDHIILSLKLKKEKDIFQVKPVWDLKKCVKCGRCSQVCRSNAVLFIKEKYPIFVQDLCNGCTACVLACPVKAISRGRQQIGTIFSGRKYDVDLITGEMRIGYEEASPIVNALKKYLAGKEKRYGHTIIDTAAGTHCNVISALIGCDLAIAVTEPTPLGAHDLDLILNLTEVLKVPSFVVLNRSDIGDKRLVEKVAMKYKARIIAEIPYRKEILEQYSKGKPIRDENIIRIIKEIEGIKKMKNVTVLSGKGGVGKSSITASLAVLLSKRYRILAADCDVDAANLALVLGMKRFDRKETIQTSEKAKLLPKKCIGCKKCFDTCIFGAVTWDDKKNRPVFDKYLCEGCGACELVCPAGAIKLYNVENAELSIGKTKYGFPIVSGQLKMGESGSGKVVTAVKSKVESMEKMKAYDYAIFDSAPGIGCPVVASIQGSDFVVAVTEPNPATINDLKRVLQVVEHFRIPYGIVINRWDLNKEYTKKIVSFAKKKKIPILGRIPYDRAFVDALVNLTPIAAIDNKYGQLFSNILDNILKKL